MLEKNTNFKRGDIVKIKHWNLEGIIIRKLRSCCVVRCNDGKIRDIDILSLVILDKKEIENEKKKIRKDRKPEIK